MHTHQARARKEGVNLGQRSFARGRAIRQKGVKAIVRSLNIDYTTTNYPTTRTGTKPQRGIIRKREAVYGPCRTLKPLAQASRTIGRQVSTPSEVVFDAHKVQGSTQAKTLPNAPAGNGPRMHNVPDPARQPRPSRIRYLPSRTQCQPVLWCTLRDRATCIAI